jgi:concanavalin A-like lectin/glucanase superfamily protein
VSDRCQSISFTHLDSAFTPIPVKLGDDPFGQNTAGADIALGTDLETEDVISQNTTLTAQLWARQRTVGTEGAWLLSDEDFTDGAYGGLGIVISTDGILAATTPLALRPGTNIVDVAQPFTQWPGTGDWHFVRVVQSGGTIDLCLDGKRKASVPVTDGHLKTVEPLLLGRNKFGVPAGESFFDGDLDDVRIFKGALPCE